jgi:hypothetical protein
MEADKAFELRAFSARLEEFVLLCGRKGWFLF